MEVFLAVVVRKRIVVGQVEDELVLQFLDGHIRRVGTRNDLEAVVEERLRLIVGDAHELDRFGWVTCCGACPHDTNGNVVVVTRFEGKGTRSLDEAAVSRRVA